jgi:beta-galactosidase
MQKQINTSTPTLKFPHFLYGGDYNPDQWIKTPEIWKEDVRLMKLAHVNSVTLAVFSWSTLEPKEGKFEFGWLDEIMELMLKNEIQVAMSTPSGARPPWLTQKYPETMKMEGNRVRRLHGFRHNHCCTSPIFREKIQLINRKLAERYKDYSNLVLWHVANELDGGMGCHCDLCQEAFRKWLRIRYHNDLEQLNHAWWTAFWSHRYSDWSQVTSPSPIGNPYMHPQILDWKRFTTYSFIDFFKAEIVPIREITPKIPLSTNFFWGTCFDHMDYWKFAKEVDVITFNTYPTYHARPEMVEEAMLNSFVHDLTRSLKDGKPYLQMECAPSTENWRQIAKLKRPGMLMTEGLQYVAHGSDSVLFFQWRKGRGGPEKFHGAVVDHVGHENTRIFREVSELGSTLAQMDEIIGTSVSPEVAIMFDWENFWALSDAAGPIRKDKRYVKTCVEHYAPFWNNGVPVDVVGEDSDISKYKLVIAPMLYMVREGVGEKIEKFVKAGGTFVTTYYSGVANESDLCFLGGFPGPLRKLMGIWTEEIDAFYEDEKNFVIPTKNNLLGLKGSYEANTLLEVIHAETAEVLAKYKLDYYKDNPALTRNQFGKGEAYYIASRNDAKFHSDFIGALIKRLKLQKVLDTKIPSGVTVQMRTNGKKDFIFLLNFTSRPQTIWLTKDKYQNLLTGKSLTQIKLNPYGSSVVTRIAKKTV